MLRTNYLSFCGLDRVLPRSCDFGKALWISYLLSVLTIWRDHEQLLKLLPFSGAIIALCAYSVFNVFSVPATAVPGRYALPFVVLHTLCDTRSIRNGDDAVPGRVGIPGRRVVTFVVGPHAIDTLRFPHGRDRAAFEAGRQVGAAVDEAGPGATYMLEVQDWDFLAVMLTAAHYDRGLLDRPSLPHA